MYNITHQELIELGFKNSGFTNFFIYRHPDGRVIRYCGDCFESGVEKHFPETLEEVKNLLK